MNRAPTVIGLLVLAAIAVPADRYFACYQPGLIWDARIPFERSELDRVSRDLTLSLERNARKARRDAICQLHVELTQHTRAH